MEESPIHMNKEETLDCSNTKEEDHPRARILRRFEVWLDEVLAEESPRAGMAQEILDQFRTDEGCVPDSDSKTDLYTLVSGFATLSEETRLQGRSFKNLHESIVPMQGMIESMSETLTQCRQTLDGQVRQSQETTQRKALSEMLDVFLDVRDRLVRGRDSARHGLARFPMPEGKWDLWRTKPWAGLREATEALAQGTDLALTRLDEALRQWGVRPIECLDLPFDVQTMAAVDVAEAPDLADGTVLEVFRTGYWWDEQVYRVAEVKVVRNQSGI